MNSRVTAFLLICLSVGATMNASAADPFITVYVARQQPTDEFLYGDFFRKTGIRVQRVAGTEADLFHLIDKPLPRNPLPDILLAADAGILARAEQRGLFDPLKSGEVENRVPSSLRTQYWTTLSTHARVIIYNKTYVKADEVRTYGQLALPRFHGNVCSRSGSHPFNQTLLATILAHEGKDRAEQWTRGIVANLARAPKGDELDQVRKVAEGDPCEVAWVNTNVIAALMSSVRAEDQNLMRQVGMVWPGQDGVGAPMNVSGVGILGASQKKEAAAKFLEYLVSDDAQRHFAVNHEWPASATLKVAVPALDALGVFKAAPLPVAEWLGTAALAREIADQVGYR